MLLQTALWFQPASIIANDHISLNGKKLSEESKRNELFQRIQDYASKISRHKIPWCASAKGYKVIKGILKNRDEKGRHMTFVYIAQCDSWENFYKQLCEELNKEGLTMTQETKHSIKSAEKRDVLKKVAMATIFITLMIALSVWYAGAKREETHSQASPEPTEIEETTSTTTNTLEQKKEKTNQEGVHSQASPESTEIEETTTSNTIEQKKEESQEEIPSQIPSKSTNANESTSTTPNTLEQKKRT